MNPSIISTKICSRCSFQKPLEEFVKDSRRRDKLSPQCRGCKRDYQAHYRDNGQGAAASRKYRKNKIKVASPRSTTPKKCSSCQRIQKAANFGTYKFKPDGLKSTCKTCSSEQNQQYNHDPKSRIRRRHLNYLRKYGITLEQYEEMFILQEGRCKICEQPPTRSKGLCVDHCHTTGAVRGLLCETCNSGLGLFQDRPELLRAAIHYLKHSTK